MAEKTINDLTELTSVDRAADYLEVSDGSDSNSSKRSNVNSLLNLTSQPVGITDTQTLTNKTFTSPTISGPTLSGTILGTYTLGGTPTFPSSVVTLTGSQTLTNKTLTSPTINTATIANPTLTVDTISEFTAANGVTIDGVLLKDSKMSGSYITDGTLGESQLTDGGVTPSKISNPYKFSVYRNAAATTGNGAFAKITFDTELFDTNSNFASGTYTVPVDGFYQFTLGAAASSSATNQRVIISLYVNGSERRRISTVWSSAGSQSLGPSGSALLHLTAGNTVEVYIFGTAAFNLDVSSAEICPYFMGFLVTPT